MLVAVFQPHTHTRYNVFDSLFFACLGVVFIILPAGQSHHTAQVYIFFLSLLIIIVFIYWKVLILKKYISGCDVISYFHQIQKVCSKFAFKSRRNNNSVITQEQEREPLVDNNFQSTVLYTVVDIKD